MFTSLELTKQRQVPQKPHKYQAKKNAVQALNCNNRESGEGWILRLKGHGWETDFAILFLCRKNETPVFWGNSHCFFLVYLSSISWFPVDVSHNINGVIKVTGELQIRPPNLETYTLKLSFQVLCIRLQFASWGNVLWGANTRETAANQKSVTIHWSLCIPYQFYHVSHVV